MKAKRLLLAFALSASANGSPLEKLDILSSGWPRAYFFRESERHATLQRVPYEVWEDSFSQLMGVEGKALNEEVPGRARALEYFAKFKARHPQKLLMLHINGMARNPNDAPGDFGTMHWLYYNGTSLAKDLPAAEGESEIEVPDVRFFRAGAGRYGKNNEDIGLCELDANGKPDWSKAEQVKLLEVTKGGGKGNAGMIRVQRAQFGTKPRAFKAGKSYAAAHVCMGPYGITSPLVWTYNFSTTCPRDAQGHTCSDILSAEIARMLGPGGKLAGFDGVEFDVLRHSYAERGDVRGGRTIDADADGKADGGFIKDNDVYGEGTLAFLAQLRQRLGKDRFILTDGWNWDHPRAFSVLNGMESEGWPKLGDEHIDDWCGGMNRGLWWNTRTAQPVLNYINHKHLGGKPMPDGSRRTAPPIDHAYNRIVFAAALMLDHALCCTIEAPPEKGKIAGVWDELKGGTANQPGWLGMPKGPPQRLAYGTPNTLPKPVFTSDNATITAAADAFTIQGKDPAQDVTTIQLKVPVDASGELLLRFTVSAQPSAHVASKAPRILRVGTVKNRFDLHHSWVDDRAIESTFYGTALPAGEATITFDIEGSEPWHLGKITAHAHPDVMLRSYDHGLVLANPSSKPFTFDLAKLLPGQKFRHLQGTALQDTKTNNGQPVGNTVTLGPKDGLFLWRQ